MSHVELQSVTNGSEMKRKPFKNLPMTTPWKYRVPISKPNENKNKMDSAPKGASVAYQNCLDVLHNQTQTRVTDSSVHYHHFLRLMQLFPGVHPAFLHTVLSDCRNDFFMTVDTLLRSRAMQKPTFPPSRTPMPVRFGLVKFNGAKSTPAALCLPQRNVLDDRKAAAPPLRSSSIKSENSTDLISAAEK